MGFTQQFAQDVIAIMQEKLKTALLQDGRHTYLTGSDRNQILNKKIYQMKMLCIDTTILSTRTIYRALILMTHTKLLFLEKPDFKNLDYKENFWINKLKSDINLAKTQYSDLQG